MRAILTSKSRQDAPTEETCKACGNELKQAERRLKMKKKTTTKCAWCGSQAKISDKQGLMPHLTPGGLSCIAAGQSVLSNDQIREAREEQHKK